MNRDFQELSHTADLAIRVYGNSFEQLLSHAIVGMFQVIRPKITGSRIVQGRVVVDHLPIHRDVTVTGFDNESVVVDLLSEILTLSDIHNEAYLATTVTNSGNYSYTAALLGVHINGFSLGEIKAVTYHRLAVVHNVDGWQVDIVFDI